MVKLKSALTAAVMLIAAGAMASNFRAADQVYVPVAGHAVGGGATFISDVFISNLSADPISISVILSSSAGGTQTNFNNKITLLANERKEFLDFFPSVLGVSSGLGQLVFNACKQGGDCNVTTCPGGSSGVCPDFRNISVESRIYSILNSFPNPATAPTTGQLFSGIPWYNFVSSDAAPVGLDKVQIVGFRNNGSYRSNIGLVNASQYSTTTLRVKLLDGATGSQIGTFDQALAPLGQVQSSVDSKIPAFTGATAVNAYVTVEQLNTIPTGDAATNGCNNGCPAFFAYGSVLDVQSGDATTLEAQYLKPLTDAAINCIYNSTGCKGSFNLHRAVHH